MLNRNKIIEISKMWPSHEGVNYETTTNLNLLYLIRDAIDFEIDLNKQEEPISP